VRVPISLGVIDEAVKQNGRRRIGGEAAQDLGGHSGSGRDQMPANLIVVDHEVDEKLVERGRVLALGCPYDDATGVIDDALRARSGSSSTHKNCRRAKIFPRAWTDHAALRPMQRGNTTMKRYLLFDSDCVLCTGLAEEVEGETGGWLQARSLDDPQIQALLQSDWPWEPALLEVEGESVRRYAGFALRRRLLTGLGPRKAWRVAQIVSRAATADPARRQVLRGALGLAAIALWPRRALAGNEAAHELRDIGSRSPLSAGEAQDHVARALASPDLIQVGERVEFRTTPVAAYRTLSRDGTEERVVEFASLAGGKVVYSERAGAAVASKAYYLQVDDKGARLLALSVNGESVDLGKDGTFVPRPATQSSSGCSWEVRAKCRGCGPSSRRPTEELCYCCLGGLTQSKTCVSCQVSWWGPCGLC